MLYGNYRFECQFESDGQLPIYKGSTFRGVFGHALKSVVCALKRQTCTDCLLKSRCIYTLVFETGLAKPLPEGLHIDAAPHPFVIEPPENEQTDFNPGDAFDFNLILFGEVNHHMPYFIYAFDTMGKIGIGRKIKEQRGCFTLKSVKLDGVQIYRDADQKMILEKGPSQLKLNSEYLSGSNEITRITLSLKTPLRVKFQNQLTDKLPFHVLVHAMLRRTDALLRCWGDQEPDLDFKGMVSIAKEIQTVESDLHWYDWQRYSQRQDQKMLMGGLIGSVTYQGQLSEFFPLIDFCKKTHIGKQTAFGLGMIRLDKDVNSETSNFQL